jgi:hypothetical protein
MANGQTEVLDRLFQSLTDLTVAKKYINYLLRDFVRHSTDSFDQLSQSVFNDKLDT